MTKRVTHIIGLLFFPLLLTAQEYVGGNLYEDTRFTIENSPYIVVDNLVVKDTFRLMIDPGVTLWFEDERSLLVEGSLIARGTARQPVYFDVYKKNLRQNWAGIQILPNANPEDSIIVSHCHVSGCADPAISVDGRNQALITHNQINHNAGFAVFLSNSSHTTVADNFIADNKYGIYLCADDSATDNQMINNIILNIPNFGIFLNGQNSRMKNNSITGNRIHSCFYGLLLDGGSHTRDNAVSSNYFFSNITGIKINNNQNLISGNLLIDNTQGITIHNNEGSGGRFNQICHNRLQGHESAIVLNENSYENYLDSNIILENTRGIVIEKSSEINYIGNFISSNIFSDNDSSDLILEMGGQELISQNSFLSKKPRGIWMQTAIDQVSVANWWGTQNPEAIESFIWHQWDDPELGYFDYQNVLPNPHVSLVPYPEIFTKQLIGDSLFLNWQRPDDPRISGYKIYFNPDSLMFADTILWVGNVDSWTEKGVDPLQPVFVTAVDSLADGQADWAENHESEMVEALPEPFAGYDDSVCLNQSYHFEQATSIIHDSLIWDSDGQGVLVDPQAMAPEYFPALEDTAGKVKFWLKTYYNKFVATDTMWLNVLPLPRVSIIADTVIKADTHLTITETHVRNYDHLLWQTTGDGLFDNPAIPNPVYTPGVHDIERGQVALVLEVFSLCGHLTDTLNLTLVPAYFVSGTCPCQTGKPAVLTAYGVTEGLPAQKTTLTVAQDSFKIEGLAAGTYRLRYVPENPTALLPEYYFGGHHWDSAHQISVYADVFDVDFNGIPKTTLPRGEAAIRISFQPGLQNVDELTAFLVTPSGKYLDGVTVGSPGNFTDLPFGSYKIVPELYGYDRMATQNILLSPEHPVDSVTIQISGNKVMATSGMKAGKIIIYPTVIHQGFIYLMGIPDTQHARIAVYDLQGILIQQEQKLPASGKLEFNRNLAPGIYIISVYSSGKRTESKKVLIP
jgi:parallel beta-helix repeat protein